jgi:hypothetical protein
LYIGEFEIFNMLRGVPISAFLFCGGVMDWHCDSADPTRTGENATFFGEGVALFCEVMIAIRSYAAKPIVCQLIS